MGGAETPLTASKGQQRGEQQQQARAAGGGGAQPAQLGAVRGRGSASGGCASLQGGPAVLSCSWGQQAPGLQGAAASRRACLQTLLLADSAAGCAAALIDLHSSCRLRCGSCNQPLLSPASALGSCGHGGATAGCALPAAGHLAANLITTVTVERVFPHAARFVRDPSCKLPQQALTSMLRLPSSLRTAAAASWGRPIAVASVPALPQQRRQRHGAAAAAAVARDNARRAATASSRCRAGQPDSKQPPEHSDAAPGVVPSQEQWGAELRHLQVRAACMCGLAPTHTRCCPRLRACARTSRP